MTKPRSRWLLKGGKVVPHILEEDVVEEITTRLWWQYRIKVWRVRERIPREGAAPSTAGIPDLIGWIPSTLPLLRPLSGAEKVAPLFIECKRPGGARRTAQTLFIEDARRDGCIAFFAESWDQCAEELQKYGINLKAA